MLAPLHRLGQPYSASDRPTLAYCDDLTVGRHGSSDLGFVRGACMEVLETLNLGLATFRERHKHRKLSFREDALSEGGWIEV